MIKWSVYCAWPGSLFASFIDGGQSENSISELQQKATSAIEAHMKTEEAKDVNSYRVFFEITKGN